MPNLSATERDAIVTKLRAAEAELRILIDEDEECSDLRAVVERLQEIQLRIQLQS
jgi:hypothetical protein